jgi:hypothetical protein
MLVEENDAPVSAQVQIVEIPSPLEAALAYARRGKPIFPISPLNKRPLVGRLNDTEGNPIEGSGGLYRATTDEAVLREWWEKFPNAMPGMPTGERSGVVVVDLDLPKTDDGPDGHATWAKLQEIHGRAPRTRTHRTPSGGTHLFFKWDPDRPLGNTEGELAGLGINIRRRGGYVGMPPGMNEECKCYEVIDPSDEADIPEWLYRLIEGYQDELREQKSIEREAGPEAKKKYGEAALRSEVEHLAGMGPGSGRNIALNRAAFSLGTLVAANALTQWAVTCDLFEASQRNGLVREDGPRSVRQTINSGLTAGLKKPRIISERNGKDAEKKERGSNAGEGDDDLLVMLNGSLAKVEKRNDGPEGMLTGYGIIPVTVGKDDDNEDVTIGIVDPDTTQRGEPPTKKKLPDQVAAALKYLAETINEVGKSPPSSLPVSRAVTRAVMVEEWQEQCERRRLSGGKSSDAFRRAFDRAIDRLQQEGLIAVLDGYAWLLYE